MQTLAYSIAIIAGFVHVSFFYMESVAWSKPGMHRRFGVRSAEEAEAVSAPMFNLGFYNLFLGMGAIAGAVIGLGGSSRAELLTLYTMAFMVGASLVLVGSNPKMMRAALIQGLLPAVAFLLLLVG